MMQIAIVARPGPVLDAYREFFEKHDVNLIRAASISELLSKLSMTAVSGFMVEIHIVLKATNTEKTIFERWKGFSPTSGPTGVLRRDSERCTTRKANRARRIC